MDFSKSSHASHFLLAKSAHLKVRADLEAAGYHALSVCVSGDRDAPRYSVAFAKDPRVRPSKGFAALSQTQLLAKIAELAADDWALDIVSATGGASDAVYAAEFRKPLVGKPEMPIVKLALSFSDFEAENEKQRKAGRKLAWADCFGGSSTCVCAIWRNNIGQTTWQIEAFEDFEDGDARFHALADSWVRPELVSYAHDDSVMKLYVDAKIGHWRLLTNVTTGAYEAKRKAYADAGFFPYRITARDFGEDARVTAIFATGDSELVRKSRRSVQAGQPAVDAVIQGYMKDHNLRGAALAIVRDKRLVYAQGYNFSEDAPRYPDVLPTTPFRQASVSKTFCAVAIWRLIQLKKLSLDTKLLDVLPVLDAHEIARRVASPTGFIQLTSLKKIKIRHLLESRSGLKQNTTMDSADAAEGSLPCTSAALARHILFSPMSGSPGDIDCTSYGKADNILLGQVVRHVMKKPSFEAALKELVLDPLGMTRTRSARSLLKDQEPDEARYHIAVVNPDDEPPFRLGESVMTDARPLVPLQYGAHHYEIFDGAAGLSSAVIDMARLGAMFAVTSGNPVLDDEHRLKMLNAGVAASAAAKAAEVDGAQGFHGFDNPSKSADGVFSFSKGGSLDAVRTRLAGTVGGFVYAFAFNGEKRKGAPDNWYADVKKATKSVNWGSGDLFPSFGMPSL